METQQTQNQTMETYGINGNHTTEACPMNNKENRQLILNVASTFEEDANAKGINVISMYHSGLEHSFERIVEAPNAHSIQELMIETKVAKFNATKIVSIWTTQQAAEFLRTLE
ncbi:MAG: hypothetical protein OER82_07045 [Nitrosopumilus sp.]|nr:hypothetical protein [Nitrosopumilus sp.]